jgi:hypothetical protein
MLKASALFTAANFFENLLDLRLALYYIFCGAVISYPHVVEIENSFQITSRAACLSVCARRAHVQLFSHARR